VLEANRGNVAGMEEALATNARASKWIVEHAPAGTYLRDSRAPMPDYWRMSTLLLRGEDRLALERAATLLPKLETLKPQDVQQREFQANTLRGVHWVIARAAYALKDYAIAERAMTRVLQLHAQVPTERTGDRRDLESERIFMALVLARLGRIEETQKLATAALKYERELAARNRDSAWQRIELAQALYVAAISGFGDANVQLAEADAIMRKLPVEMQKLRDVAIWQERITEERARRRGA
jgi:hypothetical protein